MGGGGGGEEMSKETVDTTQVSKVSKSLDKFPEPVSSIFISVSR